ncbi:FMN-binding protein MioC [Xenorhabdus nematophila]|uniref:FMN-binding protein, required for biotin synthase activity n=1 Tax=Xenorhabdus nematophila (strain ATCC 19061 / DSM 3370 / CCUG 14189 / LMG 1036 / NCIMB 9965 / AN6) TaxID=406817 RepID=D3VG38_XENNA|nr:FMN-binding protein MioC [Xenorhabdus nematophila]CEE89895.1 FMN-binding protein, required for biotin synthase activity [Xenorhabdus nematophila str. Anatoliense]CEF33576.1 FMN-binding protein, required for biotin synthase activity [Xenorhabdus nematophila str. Websteri]AYA41649.1 FMN-binding protein MioC [Xenorhabdus nematophila]KHD29133.1 FMN-binding protein MioC [Xenorhabdus nematophila]MBA0020386.1 FMN-binding protein MioC [Xenorhabdus nematophila]
MSTITLISGSTMGSAEYVAEHIAEILEDDGFSTEVLHGPSLDDLPLEGLWLVVTSTHGAGDLPENLQSLSDAIAQQQPDLSKITFGAVGIGSSEYDTFCGAIRSLERLLEDLGAKRIGDRLEIDILKHEIPEDPAGEWAKEWAKLL